MSAGILDRPLVVVTGKGGVGKSTVAAALGLAAARAGKRVVIAEVAARDDVSRTFDAGPARGVFDERALADGVWHVSIDPQAAMEEYLRDQLPTGLAGVLAGSKTFGVLALATPGMRELLTVGKVWELAQPDRRTPGARPYDVCIVDAPATGHGLAILTAPRTFADAARVGPVARQGRTIHEMLADAARTAVVAVATPEEMPVNETLALRDELRAQLPGQDLSAVVCNRVAPARLSGVQADRVAAAVPALPLSVARAAQAGAGRAATQRAQLRRLKSGLDGVQVHTLPLVLEPEVGITELAGLSRELSR